MARSRPRGSLERSAVADLFKHTLSQIPTQYGRLAYLASLRDVNSGAYRHHGMFLSFGREHSVEALQSSHASVFEEWVALSLEEKAEDLAGYLAGLDDTQTMVIRHWKQTRIYRTLLPASASPAQTELFFTELDLLLDSWR